MACGSERHEARESVRVRHILFARRYFSDESGALGVGELEALECFPFLSEGFGPVMTSTMPSRNSMAIMVSIIKFVGDASLSKNGEHLTSTSSKSLI